MTRSRVKGEALLHATRGVVRAIDASTMTVSRPKNRGDITFRLSPSLYREGAIVVGSTVGIRYRDEGNVHVATAITVQKSLRPQTAAPNIDRIAVF